MLIINSLDLIDFEGIIDIRTQENGKNVRRFREFCEEFGIFLVDVLLDNLDEKEQELWNSCQPDNESFYSYNDEDFVNTSNYSIQMQACYEIIYDNPLLNDKHIVELMKSAKDIGGADAIKKIISLSTSVLPYAEFQILRHKIGDEVAVK